MIKLVKVNIKELLDERDKSLYWLAKSSGLAYASLHNLVNGKTSSIAFETLERLCDVLDCDVCDIIEYVRE